MPNNNARIQRRIVLLSVCCVESRHHRMIISQSGCSLRSHLAKDERAQTAAPAGAEVLVPVWSAADRLAEEVAGRQAAGSVAVEPVEVEVPAGLPK